MTWLQSGSSLGNTGQAYSLYYDQLNRLARWTTDYPNGSFLTYSPFGTPMDCAQSATAYKFTSKEQDAESSLDHFRYRKYSKPAGSRPTRRARWRPRHGPQCWGVTSCRSGRACQTR